MIIDKIKAIIKKIIAKLKKNDIKNIDTMKIEDTKVMYTQMEYQKEIYPYVKKYILTKNEYRFYNQLRQITDKLGYQELTKVRLADLIEVDKSKINQKEYYRYFNQIQSKHIDFVICDNRLNVLMAVELDDNSHNTDRAKKSDELKNQALSVAGIRLIRCKGIEVVRQELVTEQILNITSL